jgi:phosphoglycolate phosphatase-like HAD superfamily hydrolase
LKNEYNFIMKFIQEQWFDRIRGIVFDVDGTLLDSNDAHAEAWLHALNSHHCRVSLEEVRKVVGMNAEMLVSTLAGATLDSSERHAIRLEKNRLYRERYLDSVKPFPRARELVQYLNDHGKIVDVATPENRDDLEKSVDHLNIRPWLQAKSSTPLRPGEMVLVGDTPYDIEAANRAGAPVIAFRTGGWSDEAMKDAVMIFNGPWEMLDVLNRKDFEHSIHP